MAKQDIKAGRAYVELMMRDNKFTRGLAAAKDKLVTFAAGVISISGVMKAAKWAIDAATAPLRNFISTGDELLKMSQRTGMTVESLSELKYAAERTGVSLADIESAANSLRSRGLDPRKFEEYIGVISQIEDPVRRARKATEVFGGAGAKLLPMMGNLKALKQEARDLGLVMSTESAQGAVRLKDMFTALWATVSQIGMQIGQAVAPFVEVALPVIQAFATLALEKIKGAGDFIMSNVTTVTTFVSDTWTALVDFVSPIIGALVTVVTEAFDAIWAATEPIWTGILNLITSVWGSISEETGGVMTWLQDTIIGVFRGISFAINNWKLLAEIAFKSALAAVVTFANQTVYFFGTVVPAWLSWFGENWREVFTDVFNWTATVVSNLWKNLVNLWDSIVGLFSGDGWEFEWTNLTDGFESAIKELPVIAEREIGPLERQLKDDLNELGEQLNQAWEDHGEKFKKKVDKFTPKGTELKTVIERQEKQAQERRDMVAAANPGGAQLKREVFGAFSAAALAAQGGHSPSDKVVKELVKQREEQRDQHRELVAEQRKARVIGA